MGLFKPLGWAPEGEVEKYFTRDKMEFWLADGFQDGFAKFHLAALRG